MTNKLLSAEEIKAKQAAELARVLTYVGGTTALAAQLNVPQKTAYAWVHRGRVSATIATEIERISGGLFKRTDLRPDVADWHEPV